MMRTRCATSNRLLTLLVATQSALMSTGVNRQTLHPRFIIKTMGAAVAYPPEDLPGSSTFFDRNHLDTHRHCLLAFKATDNLRKIDHIGDIGIFSWYFPH